MRPRTKTYSDQEPDRPVNTIPLVGEYPFPIVITLSKPTFSIAAMAFTNRSPKATFLSCSFSVNEKLGKPGF